MRRILVDANVVLRFLRRDDPVQSEQAKRLMVHAKEGKYNLVLSVLTVAEVFYALRASYKLERGKAAAILTDLLCAGLFEVEEESVLLDALRRVQSANVDLGDAMLAAQALNEECYLASFDQDFLRFPELLRHDLEKA